LGILQDPRPAVIVRTQDRKQPLQDDKPASRAEENKANQSQFPAPALTKGAGKREKSVAAATG